jgi:transposase InsO family protein
MEEFARKVERDYGITRKPTTTRNPQTNSIIERIHQTIGNIIRSFQIGHLEVDEQGPGVDVWPLLRSLHEHPPYYDSSDSDSACVW